MILIGFCLVAVLANRRTVPQFAPANLSNTASTSIPSSAIVPTLSFSVTHVGFTENLTNIASFTNNRDSSCLDQLTSEPHKILLGTWLSGYGLASEIADIQAITSDKKAACSLVSRDRALIVSGVGRVFDGRIVFLGHSFSSSPINNYYMMSADTTKIQYFRLRPNKPIGLSVARDGKQMAFIAYYPFDQTLVPANNVLLTDIDGHNLQRITNNGYQNRDFGRPVWSPDSKSLLLAAQEGGKCTLYVVETNGSAKSNFSPPSGCLEYGWSPDGKSIVVLSEDGSFGNLSIMNPDGTNSRALHLPNNALPWDHTSVVWLPDGQSLLFASQDRSDETKPWKLYKVNIDGSNLQLLYEDQYAIIPLLAYDSSNVRS